ncbi:MAG: hypothetical protein AB7O38_05540 [Pirellulaceae bacterium]
MNLNVFTWIREGVRQSVLAGVSDAIDQMGTPVDGDDLRPRLQDVLKRSMVPLESPAITESRPKRLGRSIKDFDLGKEK